MVTCRAGLTIALTIRGRARLEKCSYRAVVTVPGMTNLDGFVKSSQF